MRSQIASIIEQAEKQIDFSSMLHPINADEQKEGFLSGAIQEPEFVYRDITIPEIEFPDFDEEGVIPDLYRDRMAMVQLQADLLATRGDDETFSALSRELFILRDLGDVALRQAQGDIKEGDELLSTEVIVERFNQALHQYNCDGWTVEVRNNISARLMVDQWNQVLVVRERLELSEDDLQGLVRHEVGVHVLRAHNGRKQEEPLLHVGTVRGRMIEEGVAITVECAAPSPRIFIRHKAVAFAQNHTFRETWEMLKELGCSDNDAWAHVLRIKRGLSSGASHGGFTRDAMYAQAYEEMQSYIDSIDMNALLSAPIHPEEIDLFELS